MGFGKKCSVLLAMCSCLIGGSAVFASGVGFTVTTPAEFTVSDRTDTGESRIEIAAGGALISSFNLTSDDTVQIYKDKNLPSPRLKVCSYEVDDVEVTFYDCDDPDDSVTVTLSFWECASDSSRNCVSID